MIIKPFKQDGVFNPYIFRKCIIPKFTIWFDFNIFMIIPIKITPIIYVIRKFSIINFKVWKVICYIYSIDFTIFKFNIY
jgi:hypothetical protein